MTTSPLSVPALPGVPEAHVPEAHVPEAQRGEGTLTLRYEDVTQDGRMRVEPMSHAIGAAVWRGALRKHPVLRALEADGVLPILSRLRTWSLGWPISVFTPLTCRGAFELVRSVAPDGRARLRFDMAATLRGPIGRTHGSDPRSGESIEVGAVWAEHVLTRPFGPPERRAVLELPGGVPEGMPERETAWEEPSALLALPPGASWTDAWSLDPAPVALGLGHTDSNQHVNSLVYPRIVEEAALRRLARQGESAFAEQRFAHHADLAFRKPSFAGEQVHVLLRGFRLGDAPGFAAGIVGADELPPQLGAPSPRARVFARVLFTR